MSEEREIRMLDIAAPEDVEVVLSTDGKTLHVNVDGFCRLRICRMKDIIIENYYEAGKQK